VEDLRTKKNPGKRKAAKTNESHMGWEGGGQKLFWGDKSRRSKGGKRSLREGSKKKKAPSDSRIKKISVGKIDRTGKRENCRKRRRGTEGESNFGRHWKKKPREKGEGMTEEERKRRRRRKKAFSVGLIHKEEIPSKEK